MKLKFRCRICGKIGSVACSKLLEVVLEEKRREIIKEWIESGRIEDISNK